MAQKCNIKLDQGSNSSFVFTVRDEGGLVDLTGFTAIMQIRKTPYDLDAVDTLSTENGRIEIDTESAVISLKFPCFTTENYPAIPLIYDIEIESEGGEITRILEGALTVDREITRIRCQR